MLGVLNRSGIVTLSLQKVTRFAQGLVNSTSSLRTPETSVLLSALLSCVCWICPQLPILMVTK